MTAVKALGMVTRGTTAPRRLRRFDRWLVATHPALVRTPALTCVDLGFGAEPVTTLELAARLRRHSRDAVVIGLDLDAERVERAWRHCLAGVEFGVGGFELGGRRAHLVRAFNVLRQYDEPAVAPAWGELTGRLCPGGIAVDGTCDETGRLGAWVTLTGDGPQTLTLALDLTREPAAVAERLPKALIHHNVAGEPIHRVLRDLDGAWQRHAGVAVFGAAQRIAAAVADLRRAGWPILDGRRRWRRGELTVSWAAVRPRTG